MARRGVGGYTAACSFGLAVEKQTVPWPFHDLSGTIEVGRIFLSGNLAKCIHFIQASTV